METAKVVGTPNQVHARLKGLEPMSGMVRHLRVNVASRSLTVPFNRSM